MTLALIVIGVLGGLVSGLVGVGGGIVFVPGLVIFLGLSQHHAEGTSLLAIIPVVVVGSLRQRRYGNMRARDGALVGALSIGGAVAGVMLANALSGQALRVAFATLMIVIAARLIRRAMARPSDRPSSTDGAGAQKP